MNPRPPDIPSSPSSTLFNGDYESGALTRLSYPGTKALKGEEFKKLSSSLLPIFPWEEK